MRDFIPLQRVVFDLFDMLALNDERVCKYSKVWEDNKASITIVKDQSKRRSPELYCFLEHIEDDDIKICCIDSIAQRADIYTKDLDIKEFPPKPKMIMS